MNAPKRRPDTWYHTILADRQLPARVVIDTDAANEIDDQFALAWALSSPESITVEAVYATPFSFAHRRALLPDAPPDAPPFDAPSIGMARSFDEIVKIYRLMDLAPTGRVFRGSTGYLSATDQPQRSEAVDHLIAAARCSSSSTPLYVVALGCLTNIASALMLAPEIVERIVVVWTSGYPSHAPYVNNSFNLEQDALASRTVFDSGVPLVYLPGFHVGAQLRLSLAEVERYLSDQDPLSRYLRRLFSNNPLWSILGHDSEAPYSWVIWDLICIAWLIDSRWVPTTMVPTPHLDLDLRWRVESTRHPMREGHGVLRDAIFNDFFRKIARSDVRT